MSYHKLRVRHEQNIELGKADLYIYIEPSTKPQKPISVQWRYVRRRIIAELKHMGSKPTNAFLHQSTVINALADLKHMMIVQGYWHGR